MTAPRHTSALLREALALGFSLRPGSRHWLAFHPSGGRSIVPYDSRASSRSERNILASLRRAARRVASHATPTGT